MENRDLIIFSGQSNMEGETESAACDNSPVEGALEYRYLENRLVPLRHPAGENIGLNGRFYLPRHTDGWQTTQNCALLSAWKKRVNMVPYFCDSYVKASGRRVVAVHCAKGNTTIDYWQKGAVGYEMLCRKAKAAIDAVKPEHIYFVWLQGESDALSGTSKESYKEKMCSLFEALQSDLDVELFGNILVGRFAMDERDDEITCAQRELCRKQSGFVMLTEISSYIFDMPRYMNPEAFGHYSTEGQRLIGTLAGRRLAIISRQLFH